MSTLVIYEEVRFHELVFVPELMGFTYPCPCGDMFTFYIEDLRNGQCVATCPSCSLNVQLVLEEGELEEFLISHKLI